MYHICTYLAIYLGVAFWHLQETLIHGENERQLGGARSIEVFYLTTRNSTKIFALLAYSSLGGRGRIGGAAENESISHVK